jgi:drug/metabolite transporter (DMT)-like permease
VQTTGRARDDRGEPTALPVTAGTQGLEVDPGRSAEAAESAARVHARSRSAGALYIVASALCFGSMAIFGRVAFAAGVDTSTLLLLRFSLAAALMWIVVAYKRARLPRGRGLATLVAMGAVGYAGQAFAYFTALSLASAGLVALLLYLYPALVALISRLVFRHTLTPLQLGALALALGGSFLTVGQAGGGSALGIFFGVLAAFIYACYILTGSRLPRDVTPTGSSAVVTTSAAVVYAGVAALRGVRLPVSAAGWGAVFAIAVICTVLAIIFFLAGLERVGAVRASVYSAVEPAFTVLLATLVLGEELTALRVAGGALILGAVLLLARADARG